MALKISTSMKSAVINVMVNGLAGTYGTAGTNLLSFYNGSQPSDADSATSGTVIATIINVGWEECTGGTNALSASYVGTASTSGTITWARFERITASGTFRMDGEVGTSSTNTFGVNTTVFSTAGAMVTLLSGNIYLS